MVSVSPTALLKIMGALAPLMSDAATGAAMVTEIRTVFDAIKRAADAAERTDLRLANIEEKLLHLKLPLSSGEVRELVDGQAIMPDAPLAPSHITDLAAIGPAQPGSPAALTAPVKDWP